MTAPIARKSTATADTTVSTERPKLWLNLHSIGRKRSKQLCLHLEQAAAGVSTLCLPRQVEAIGHQPVL
jgi:hypothetical protein